MSKNKPSTSMTPVACESKLRSVVRGHSYIQDQETGLKSDVRSCIKLGLPTHLVQELNVVTVGTVHAENVWNKQETSSFHQERFLIATASPPVRRLCEVHFTESWGFVGLLLCIVWHLCFRQKFLRGEITYCRFCFFQK